VEQVGAEFPFERAYRLRQGRLRDLQSGGRATEAAVLDHGEEIGDLPYVQ
jgi:hypothetical protein